MVLLHQVTPSNLLTDSPIQCGWTGNNFNAANPSNRNEIICIGGWNTIGIPDVYQNNINHLIFVNSITHSISAWSDYIFKYIQC